MILNTFELIRLMEMLIVTIFNCKNILLIHRKEKKEKER